MPSVVRQAAARVRGPSDPLTAALTAAGLSKAEQYVIRLRLAGRSLRDVGEELGRTRQRVQQVEKAALAKLGLTVSLADAIHASQRADQVEFLRERSRGVRRVELSHDPAEVGPVRRRPEPWELAHERAVAEFLSRN